MNQTSNPTPEEHHEGRPSPPPDRPTRLGLHLLHSVVLCGSAGVLASAFWAWYEIGLQRYVEIGFLRSAANLMQGALGGGLLFGAMLGLAYFLFARLGRHRWRDETAALRPAVILEALRECRSRPGTLVVASLVALVALVFLAVRGGSLERDLVLGVAGAVLLFVWTNGVERVLADESEGTRLGSFVLTVGPSLVFLAFVVNHRALYTRFGLSRMAGDTAVAGCLAVLAVLTLLNYVASVRQKRSGILVGLLVVLVELPVIAPVAITAVTPRLDPGVAVANPMNVLIIGIDTLRYDHTAFSDDIYRSRELTPNLARLMERGTVFENAIAAAPWTMPSFATIFTGKYPHEHAAISKTGVLRKSEVVLAEILREAGYDTSSIVSHYFVNNTHGFGQGYDYFNREYVLGEWEITSNGISDRAIAHLDGLEGEDPFFMFLHYFDPHNDYRDHEDLDYADWYEGWLEGQMHVTNLRHKRHMFDEADIQYMIDLYDEEIVHADRAIGRVLDQLEESGRLDDTIVIVVSDHGEEFMERGWLGHSITLSEQVIRVPYLVSIPGLDVTASRIPDTVEARTVFGTVLDAVGANYPGRWAQQSLVPLIRQRPRPQSESPWQNMAFTNVWTPDAKVETGLGARVASLRTDRWKLIRNYDRDESYLYDLANDPMEETNLAEERPEELEPMKEVLDAWIQVMLDSLGVIPQRGAVEGQMRQHLKDLGYL